MGDEKLLREIGLRIHARRKTLGLTQEALAERMEVSIQMISNLGQGKKAVRLENLVKLCNELNVSVDYILRDSRADWEFVGFMEKYVRRSAENQALLEKLAENLLK